MPDCRLCKTCGAEIDMKYELCRGCAIENESADAHAYLAALSDEDAYAVAKFLRSKTVAKAKRLSVSQSLERLLLNKTIKLYNKCLKSNGKYWESPAGKKWLDKTGNAPYRKSDLE